MQALAGLAVEASEGPRQPEIECREAQIIAKVKRPLPNLLQLLTP